MCGIVGYIGSKDAKDMVLTGLQQLEYRGYDSAGIALVHNQEVKIYKDQGRVEHLRELCDFAFCSHLGIGHTRWATHGVPNKINSHPHISNNGRFVLVHNGVIENYKKIKYTYLNEYTFYSETDTEVVANLIEYFSNQGKDTRDAILMSISELEGSYALLVIDQKDPNKIYFAKNKTPLIIGVAYDGVTIASDVIPLAGHCDQYVGLEDKTFGYITKEEIHLFNYFNKEISLKMKNLDLKNNEFGKGDFDHFMLKEIHEQPSIIRHLIQEYFDKEKINISPEIIKCIKNCTKINLVACGTSMYASYMAKYYFEKLCNIPSEVFVASELVYSSPLILDKPCFIYLSQSGETADSIAVMKKFMDKGYPSIAITNSVASSMAHLATYHLDIFAGKEIAVASTKAYIAQIVVCAILAKAVSGQKTNLKNNLSKAALAIEKILEDKILIKNIAKEIVDATNVFYIGRGIDYWVCLEAALKLKEISYIHTEAFSSGELKHGSIYLIDRGVPVIAICTQEGTNSIVRSNLIETKSRGAKDFVFAMESMSEPSDDFIIPNVAHYLAPIVSVVVCQLLAYYVATLKGNDVDKPKNLAKSVTVE